MKLLRAILVTVVLLVVGVSGDLLTAPLTIDRMYVGDIHHSFTGATRFPLFGHAQYYVLSDASTWNSGAGSSHAPWSTLADVLISGSEITYTFNPPDEGFLYRNTEYNGGDHSAQGELGLPASLSITADLGGTTGSMSGYTPIVSNDETWYGEPRFNYYTAPVGAYVYFEVTYTLLSGEFTADTFDNDPSYRITGYVDFTNVIPEPASSGLLSLVTGGIYFVRRFFTT